MLEKDHPERVLINRDGWEKDEDSKSLLPVTVPEGAALAPLDIIKVIMFGCTTDQPCANDMCMC